jgi:thioredoxin 1
MHEITLESIKRTAGKLLVYFTALWCGPCKQITPYVEKLTEEQCISLVKVDMEANQPIAVQLNVRSLPTLILFRNGAEVGRRVGFITEKKLREFLWS